MKRIIALSLCLILLMSVAPASYAEDVSVPDESQSVATEVFARCTLGTYHENNQGKINSYDKTATLFCGNGV